MSNSLIKDFNVSEFDLQQVFPGTPYTPAQPARTVYETRTVCGFYYNVPGRYVYATDSVTNQTRVTFIPDVPGSIGGSAGIYQCRVAVVPVQYPATQVQPYVPPRYVPGFTPGANLGFNAGARSATFFTANGYVQFQVRASVVGVIVGINCTDGIDSGYNGNTTDYAFYCARGIAFVIENGVIQGAVGTYTDATVFRVSRTSTTITYTMAGSTVKTTTGALTTAGWLEAALYSAGDEVFNPSVVQVSAADTSTKGSDLVLTLAPMALLTADMPYAEMSLALAPVTTNVASGLLAPDYAVLSIQLPDINMDASALTGEVAQVALTLPPMELLYADHPYGAMALTLAPLDTFLDATEGNTNAFMSSVSTMTTDISAATLLVVTMTSTGVVTTSMATSVAIDALMVSSATLSSVFSLSSVQDAIMRSVATATSLTGIPEDEFVTWVVNTATAGSTSYTEFAFNSYANIGGRYYGAGTQGVYELDGDTDSGAPVRASMSLGKLDFGTATKKTVQQCYVGMSGEGNLFVKVTAEGRDFIYKTRSYSEELQQQRVTFGKGLRTNYVWLEIYNEDGADFEIDTVEFQVADLTRRI